MSIRKPGFRAAFILSLSALGAQLAIAASKPAKTWWPDPSTGLMWTGSTYLGTGMGMGMDFQKASDYCGQLKLAGYSDWRLPTLDEVKAITYLQNHDAQAPQGSPLPRASGSAILPSADSAVPAPEFVGLLLKGGISNPYRDALWTTTMEGTEKAWTVFIGMPTICHGQDCDPHLQAVSLTDHIERAAVCTRTMEAGLLQTARDAGVNSPVPDLATLQASVPIRKAQSAYKAGDFNASIAASKDALQINPHFVVAYWAEGLCYGRLGQWDLAISSLSAAHQLNKEDGNVNSALKWAQENQKAVRNGKPVKAPTPDWN